MKHKITFALLMGIITTGIISFTLISVNIGYTPQFLKIWLKSWGIAYLIVIPALLIIAPRIQKKIETFQKETTVIRKKILFALIMGVVTTGIISFSLISINIGFKDIFLKIWIKSWMIAYLVVIPVILILAPRLEKVVVKLLHVKD